MMAGIGSAVCTIRLSLSTKIARTGAIFLFAAARATAFCRVLGNPHPVLEFRICQPLSSLFVPPDAIELGSKSGSEES